MAAGMLALTVTLVTAAPVSGAAVTRSEVAGLSPTAPALVLGGPGTAYDPAGDQTPWYAMADAYDSGTAESPTRPVQAGYVRNYDYGVPRGAGSAHLGQRREHVHRARS